MLIQILISILIGILFGTLTGLIPGIHINLVGTILVSLSLTSFSQINEIYLIVFITAMAITHTFTDFIPSVFLGCPDTDTELSILPSHELLKDKRGYEAVELSNYGSLAAIILTIIIIFPSIYLIKTFYPLIQNYIPYFLIFISLILILTEKNKLNALKIFILTGTLGTILFFLDVKEPLLPLLTGLFGASNILLSIKNKTEIPKQIITKPKVNLKKPILGGLLASPLCSFLPAMGSGQAAVIGNLFTKNSKEQFLVLIGITNTLVMAFSFVTLYLIGKTRTGAAASIKEIIGNLETKHLILIISVVIITGIIAFFLTQILGKYFSQKINKINYKKLSIITLIILTTITLLISGVTGIIVLIISTATGIYSINTKSRRTNMMGCLIIPTILLLFGVIGN